jgi:Domain of Unknown Function (DUF1080)
MKTINFIAVLCAITFPLLGADEPGTNAAPTKPERVKKVEKAPNFVRATVDPLIGDWQGEGGLVAQVYLMPGGKYQANLLTAFDTASNVIAVLQGSAPGETMTFNGDGWNATIVNAHFTGSNGDKKFDLQPVVRTSPTLGAKPPEGSVVLFDGSNLDSWAKKNGKDWLTENGAVPWKLLRDGTLEIVPTTESIITHKKFGDCHLHVEFRTIGYPSKSAVFLEARYEININETYGHTTGNMTGGMDNTTKGAAPRVRAALPPLAWQTFDIDFRAPRFDASGNKTENPGMTVLLNGVNIYNNQKLDPPFGAAGRLGEAPTGPLMLQDHQTPLQYRNIWLVEKID